MFVAINPPPDPPARAAGDRALCLANRLPVTKPLLLLAFCVVMAHRVCVLELPSEVENEFPIAFGAPAPASLSPTTEEPFELGDEPAWDRGLGAWRRCRVCTIDIELLKPEGLNVPDELVEA